MERGTVAPGRTYGKQSAAERHDERRARLMDAGLDLFGTQGYAETAIGPLCKRANVSTRSFYEHFESREALLIALHDDINAQAATAVVRALAERDDDDLDARALAGVTAYLRTMTADRRWARIALIESVGVSREAEAHRQAAITRFAALIELEGERAAPGRDHRLAAIALVGAVNGLVNTWTVDPDWDAHIDDVARTAATLIVTTLVGSA